MSSIQYFKMKNECCHFIEMTVCVLPLLFVKRDSSLKEANSQMLILSYAAIKRLRNIRTYSDFL